jgi:hypothetical protein
MESHNPAMFQSAPNRYLNNAIQDWYEHQFNEVQSASCWGFFHNMDEGFPATKRLTEQSSWAQEQRGLKSLNTELEIEYWVKKSRSNGIIATWNIMKHITRELRYIPRHGLYIPYMDDMRIIYTQYFPVLRHFSPPHWEIPLNSSRRRVSGGTVVPGADNPSATTQSRANPQG